MWSSFESLLPIWSNKFGSKIPDSFDSLLEKNNQERKLKNRFNFWEVFVFDPCRDNQAISGQDTNYRYKPEKTHTSNNNSISNTRKTESEA